MGDDPPRGRGTLDVGIEVRVPGRLPLAARRMGALVAHVLRAERCSRAWIQLWIVTAPAIARVHRRVQGTHGVTDIVTLEHRREAPGAPVVGEIWIAPDVARANARRFGTAVRLEMARLVVHGTLHALGWEHPVDATRERSAMWRRQERHLASAAARGVI